MTIINKEHLAAEITNDIMSLNEWLGKTVKGMNGAPTTIGVFDTKQFYINKIFEALHDYVYRQTWGSAMWDGQKIHLFDAISVSIEYIGIVKSMRRHAISFGDVELLASHVFHAANARAKYDSYFDDNIGWDFDLTINEVAALANMSVQSVRNAISHGEINSYRCLENLRYYIEGETYITAQELSKWLPQKRKFIATNYVDISKLENEVDADDLVDVPIASDGTIFHPSLIRKRRNAYEIGKKGNEKYIPEFLDALDELKIMDKAYWRRPNDKGNFGSMVAVGWKSISLNKLKLNNSIYANDY